MTNSEYKQNVKLLKEYAKAYYIDDEPLVSDYEYDLLYKKVQEYESANPNLIDSTSPTRRVGSEIIDSFTKETHLTKMFSLEDVFSINELKHLKKSRVHHV